MSKVTKSARVDKMCLNCGGAFSVPRCRDWREHCCSSTCKKARREAISAEGREARKRRCISCGRDFVARATQIANNQGRYCSVKCSAPAALAQRSYQPRIPDDQRKRKGREYAKRTYPRQLARLRADYAKNPQKYRSRLAAYRARNPEKVREWSHARRRIERLPRGTVIALRALQRDQCVICRCSLVNGFHLDHIYPLAMGGKHERRNLQLLCPTCNVRKSAKHPIDYMQSRGFLL